MSNLVTKLTELHNELKTAPIWRVSAINKQILVLSRRLGNI